MIRTALTILCGLALGASPALAESPEILSELSARLEAARYVPTETDLHWTGWIGAGVGLLRVGNTTANFTADAETILGNTRRAFDATQINYHLEPSLRQRWGRHSVALFFHHVSRHAVDRPKARAVDWNVLGLRASLRLPRDFPAPTRVTVSAGHTTLAALVGYRWEITGRVEIDLVTRPWGQAYIEGEMRIVTVESSPDFPRDGFTDLRLEGGARLWRGARALELFAAFERRNDVFLEVPGVRDRALFGFRILLAEPALSAAVSSPAAGR